MIYIDMDEVITDFVGWASSIDPDYNRSKSYFTEFYNKHYESAFIDQKPLDLLEHFAKMYSERTDVKFLSSVPPFSSTAQYRVALENKRAWLSKYVPGFQEKDLIVVYGQFQKINFADKGHTLYDDNFEIINEWKARGAEAYHTIGKPI